MAGTSYKIRGIEPPDLGQFPPETRKLYWSWVVELGLRAKGKEILAGLDKDGNPLKAISKDTREHRKSVNTASGKGDPSAPPLIPGWQKSRTYALLAGRAFTTHAEFYWRYDTWTGELWGDILAYQRKQGRDVIGTSVAAVAKVKAQSWAKWESWKQGTLRQVTQVKAKQKAIAVPRVGRYAVDHATLGVSSSGGSAEGVTFLPGRSTGFTTPQERAAWRRETASAKLPGRPANPAARSPISGPKYNRIIAATWGQGSRRGGSSGTAAPVPPPPPRPREPAPVSPRATEVPPADFVAAVLRAVAAVPAPKLYGDNKAWIHHVWEEYRKLPGALPLSLEQFKALIVEDYPLRSKMARADLVQAMNPADVEASNTHYRAGSRIIATFNFFKLALL
jgi:hypothetical protein